MRRSRWRRSKDFATFFEERPEKMLPNMVPGSASANFPRDNAYVKCVYACNTCVGAGKIVQSQ